LIGALHVFDAAQMCSSALFGRLDYLLGNLSETE